MGQYSPIQARDALGASVPFSFATMQMRISKAGYTKPVYIGYARPNVSVDEPGWLIMRQSYDESGDIVHVEQAVNGNVQKSEYNQIWDDSVAITITAISKAAVAEVTTDGEHGLETGDLIEIMDSDMTEVNGNEYGSTMFEIKVTAPTTFTLVNPNTGEDVNSSAYVVEGTEGSVFKRTYGELNYA